MKTKHIPAAEEALRDILKSDYAAATVGLKGASDQCVENFLTRVTLKRTLDGLLIRNLEKGNQAQNFLHTSTQSILNSKSSTYPFATVLKIWMDNTAHGWHLETKEDAHHTNCNWTLQY